MAKVRKPTAATVISELKKLIATHGDQVFETNGRVLLYSGPERWIRRLIAAAKNHERMLTQAWDKGLRFCVEALEEALTKYGCPEIFNTDQGVQFTSAAFTNVLEKRGIKISMDGKGRCLDNIFCERLWRSLKYEEVYLKAYETPKEAKDQIGKWFAFYNDERPHQALGYKTPSAFFAANKACGYDGQREGALPTSPQVQPPQQLEEKRNEKEGSHEQKDLIQSVIASCAVRAGAVNQQGPFPP